MENKPKDARALIERGEIAGAENGAYLVKSLDRDGITAKLKSIDGTTYDAEANPRVYFFLHDDGTGRIIGLIE